MNRSIPKSPKVLLIGSGAREHAIAWKLSQSRHDVELYAAPGNPGIAEVATCVALNTSDVHAVVLFAKEHGIDLVVVGPEAPLAAGLVDACTDHGIRAFGPVQSAAMLESSKAFAKEVMQKAGVPTASYAVFQDADSAKRFIRQHGVPIVIKADGLAAGKGVTVAHTFEDAFKAVDDALVDARFGQAGRRVVIESFMEGKEVSLMFFVDANTVVPMVSARDHKRVFDNDQGPNTGGMGAFAPVEDFAKAGMAEVVERTIVRPTLAELQNRGITYRGVLYVGLMMTAEGPKVVEFNARFGDPETEVVLPLLKTDLFEILWAVTEDALADVNIEWEDGAAVCVVLTAAGYPASPRTGDTITMDLDGLDGSLLDDGVGRDLADRPTDRTAEIAVFHAGTALLENRLVTAGGRVLTVTGKATTVNEARKIAYAAAEKIYFDGKHMRRDIAQSGSTDCDNAHGFGRRL